MKKNAQILILMLCLAISVASVTAHAENYWDRMWQPGIHTVQITEADRNRFDAIWEKIDQGSAGTLTRKAQETGSIKYQYEEYLALDTSDLGSVRFDDIGEYRWSVGLPDEQSISSDEALRIAFKIYLDELGIPEEELENRYPQISYETWMPGEPIWMIQMIPYRPQKGEVVSYQIGIYAHDGSIAGYRSSVAAG